MRILVSRTDRLGDALLALPTCALLKARHDAEIICLARAYTAPFLRPSTQVDRVVDWDAIAALPDHSARAEALRTLAVDAVVHLFPRRDIARAARAAGIVRRIGTGRRWFHWLTTTERVHRSRRASGLHEAQLNALMTGSLLALANPPDADDLGQRYGLVAPAPSETVRALLVGAPFTLVVHPLSSGSSPRWPLARIAELVSELDPAQVRVVITGGPAERDAVTAWAATLTRPVRVACDLAPDELMALLAGAGGFIACSTGPMHLAAALGTRTLGVFPHPATSPDVGRWRPLGPRAEVITPEAPCPDCARRKTRCPCLATVSGARVAAVVARWRAD